MYDAPKTTARALFLALALAGCDEGGGSDDAPPRDDDAPPLDAADAGAGIDGGDTLDARAPSGDGRASAEPGPSPRDGSSALAEAGSVGAGGAQGDASAGLPPSDGTERADAATPPALDAAARDAQPVDASVDGQQERDAQPADATADARVEDASVNDASAAPDAEAPACVEQGERCDRASCCTGVCVRDDEGGAVCAAECELPTRCEGCGPYCGASRMGAIRCDDAVLITEDGVYLGEAAGSALDRDSVCNESGTYGSSFGRLSIFNANGMYGNSSGRHSAYNMYSLSPPAIVCRGSDDIIAYVSKNSAQARTVVDPDELCAWLRQRGM